jgi:hypothetical protein
LSSFLCQYLGKFTKDKNLSLLAHTHHREPQRKGISPQNHRIVDGFMVKILKGRSGESDIWEDKNSGTIATREIFSHFVPFPIVHFFWSI